VGVLNKGDRNLYLSNMDVEEAIELFFNRLEKTSARCSAELVDIIKSVGRVTSEAVFARLSSPNFNASAMDGITVKARNTFGASETNPIRLKKYEDFIYVDTGDPISDPYDAVIMIEDV
jgi:putative molybdopterin biosynthesis protein